MRQQLEEPGAVIGFCHMAELMEDDIVDGDGRGLDQAQIEQQRAGR